MSALFTPETRSEQCDLHEVRPALNPLLASPRFMVLAALMVVGLVGMYLSTFIVPDLSRPWVAALTITGFLVTGIGMLVVGATSRPVGHVRLMDVGVCTAAAAIAQFLTREAGMPLLVAGSVVAVVIGLSEVIDSPVDWRAAGAGYAGVCVGLLPPYVTQSSWLVIAAAVISGALWSLVGPSVWTGIGGRMGTVAFIGASFIYLIADAFGMERDHTVLPLPMSGLAHWSVVPVGAIAAVLTWIVIDRLRVPFVLASGTLSLVVCTSLAVAEPVPQSVLSVAFFGGTFVGGVSARRLPNVAWVAAAGAIYGSLMLHFQGPLTGHVGVIGATGSIACLTMAGLEWAVLHPAINEPAGRLLRRRRTPA